MYTKAVHDIAISRGCGNFIGSRFVGTSLWGLSSIHEPCIHCCKNRSRNWYQHRGKHLGEVLGSIRTNFVYRCRWDGKELKGGWFGILFAAKFWLWDTTVAPRQGRNKRGWDETDGFAWGLDTSTHYMCVACLMLWTLDQGTTMANQAARSGGLCWSG